MSKRQITRGLRDCEIRAWALVQRLRHQLGVVFLARLDM